MMHTDDIYPHFSSAPFSRSDFCTSQMTTLAERERKEWIHSPSCKVVESLAAWDELPNGRSVLLAYFGKVLRGSNLEWLHFFTPEDEIAYQEIRYLRATTLAAIMEVKQEFLDLHRTYVVWQDNVRSEAGFPRIYSAMLWKEQLLQKGEPFVHPPVSSDIAEMVYTRYRARQERGFVHDPATIAVELDPVTVKDQEQFAFWGTLPVRYRVRYQCVAPWVEEWCRLREDLITAADAGAAHAVAEQCIAQLHAYREQVAQWQLVSHSQVGLFQMLGGVAQWRAAQLG